MSLESSSACEGKGKKLCIHHTKAKTDLFIIILDLKAFERRLTEVIACLQPATIRWRSE